ncbi:hypothetical protein NECAME_07103 [Necator americanus]|uniref:Uncharacterized protein n=1 Tax=Necator americanus TaxID=51031 RepID=W2TSJ7_NECAM|nr:hypothetical protein NECAME_07103 [Necator americanus]ETN84007.1 hypothetical protein NECAME_07103 [Necator americanus]
MKEIKCARMVKSVNMALILDYDEKTLREHMEKRGMGMEIIDQRIKNDKVRLCTARSTVVTIQNMKFPAALPYPLTPSRPHWLPCIRMEKR